MVLDRLKQIRDELKNSAEVSDRAFKNTALIAAQELSQTSQKQNDSSGQKELNTSCKETKQSILQRNCNNQLDKKYFIEKYGSLKNAKAAYQEIYGKQKYGRSWSDFITLAQKLSNSSPKELTELSLEVRITRIENFLQSLGYQF